MNKKRLANITLWAAYGLALLASLNHVAWAFGTLEFPGQQWNGYLAAIAVDAGLAALAYAIQQRRRTRRPVRTLWAGVISFASISAFANLLHALTVQTAATTTITLSTFSQSDPLALIKAIALSATLPLLVVYLGEVVSTDDAETARANARAERKAAKAADHNAVLDDINTRRQLDKRQATAALLTYLDANPDAALSAAGQHIGRAKSTTGNYVQQLTESGRLSKNGNGWKVHK